MTFETRSVAEAPEIRSEGGKLTVAGVAIRYGAKSKPIQGRFREEIRSGASTKTLQERDIMAWHEHTPAGMLGRTSSGTLRMFDGPDELRYEVDLPDTSAGRDVATLMERGDIRGSSFGFRALPKSVQWTTLPDGMALRSVGEIMLHHVATTCDPAYTEATADVALRSLAAERDLDLRSVLDAAERGELGALLIPTEDRSTDDEEGRDDPTLYRRLSIW